MKIDNRSLQTVCTIAEQAESRIAVSTQQASNIAGSVAMIDMRRFYKLAFANSTCTVLGFKHRVILRFGQAKAFQYAHNSYLLTILRPPFACVIIALFAVIGFPQGYRFARACFANLLSTIAVALSYVKFCERFVQRAFAAMLCFGHFYVIEVYRNKTREIQF